MDEKKQNEKPLELKVLDFKTALTTFVNGYYTSIPAMFIADSLRQATLVADAMAEDQLNKLIDEYNKPEKEGEHIEA